MTTQEKALALIERSPIATFVNIGGEGAPQVKAMFKTKNDGLKTFWFCSNTSSKRVQQLKRDGNASLYFYEFNEMATDGVCKGLMLSGKAEITYDDALRKSFWQEGMEMYYPQGPLDPDFAVIVFMAEHGNFYANLINEDFDI